MSIGLVGRKSGMTRVFTEAGLSIPVTVVEVAPNRVTQIKTEEVDGYSAVQLATGDKKEKNTSKAMLGHFAKAKTSPKRHVVEFRDFGGDLALGDTVAVADLFAEGERIDVVGVSKGKGFQGVVKRHGFGGVGDSTHGQHNRQRAPGSVGASSTPSRVFKGMRMAGRTGGRRVTMQNLEVVRILGDQNAVLVRGATPGAINGLLRLVKRNG